MTDFKFGDTTVVRVHEPVNEQFAISILEETFRNYTGKSANLGTLDQVKANPANQLGPPALVEGILDVSGSMKEELNGETKLDIGKLLFLKKLNKWVSKPIGVRTTFILRALGQANHSVPECQETDIVVPAGRLCDIEQYRKIVDWVLGVKPHGRTPLTYALYRTYQDLYKTHKYWTGSRHSFIVNDGTETGCMNNPEAWANLLKHPEQDPDNSQPNQKNPTSVDVHSLGLDNDAYGKLQLSKVADDGNAQNSESMAEALSGVQAPSETYGESNGRNYVFPAPSSRYRPAAASESRRAKADCHAQLRTPIQGQNKLAEPYGQPQVDQSQTNVIDLAIPRN